MKTRVTELLGIEYPVISAAMTWGTSAELVAAVSNAGGMGVLGPNAGQNEVPKSMEEFIENTKKEIQKVRLLTDKPFGMNYIFPFGENESSLFTNALFDILIEEKVKIVVAIGETINTKELKRLKDNDIIVLFRHLSPTVELIVEAEKTSIDAIIITGQEAGGHISKYPISTCTLLSQVSKIIEKPIIAAGGIIDGLGAKAVFSMGAESVYMGTRFLATVESPANSLAKEAIIKVKSEEFLQFDALNIRTTPTLAGEKAKRLLEMGNYEEAMKVMKNGYKAGIIDGDSQNGTLSISPAAGGINRIVSAKEVIDEIMEKLI